MNRTESRGPTVGVGNLPARDNAKFRARRLATCVAAAISPMFLDTAFAAYPPALQDIAFLTHSLAGQPNPSSPNPPWIVQNCNNDGTGSLRDIITSVAQSGDTVDLSQLTCSTITLTTGGAIVVAQNDLTLIGPIAGSLTISGNDASRVLEHTGFGLLSLNYLTVAHGHEYLTGLNNAARGGCIFSAGSIDLYTSTVTECRASSDVDHAQGGGIYASQSITMTFSSISNNEVTSLGPNGVRGGGVATWSLSVKYSSITSNIAEAANSSGNGGGATAWHSAIIRGSTIDGNKAPYGGGLDVYGQLQISSSTLSQNVANASPALRWTGASGGTISGSTIALNHATDNNSVGAVYLGGQLASTTFDFQSTLIADNTVGPSNAPSDLYLHSGKLTGAGNLVITTNQSPPNFTSVTSDPKLGPLQFNGGWTKTHALLPGSPAISMGNNNTMQLYDQRGPGYPRTTGAAATTDIGAFQFDTIFADPFD